MNRHGHRIGCLVITALISGGAHAAVIGLGNYVLLQADASIRDDRVRTAMRDTASTGSQSSIYAGEPLFVATAEAAKSGTYSGQVGTARAVSTIDMANDLNGVPPVFKVSGSLYGESVRCTDPVFCLPQAMAQTELHMYFQVTDAPEDATFTYSYLMGHTGDRVANSTFASSSLLYDGGFALPAQTSLFSLITYETPVGVVNPSGATTVTLPVGFYHFSFLGDASSNEFGGSAFADYALDLRFGPTPVPLPAAAWLMISGLGGVAAFARRRRSPEVHAEMTPA